MKQYIAIILFFASINSMYSQNTISKDSVKKTELEEITVQKKKKAIEQKADRTIYNFSEQAYLNSGTLMEGLKKLPGLIISDVAGIMYQGKQLEVYMDGRPTNMYSDELNSYLQGLPANSIEKVELITQPGAEFPATSGGAIINIVTSKKSKKYLSTTYSNGYSFTNYDKYRNKFNNSILLNAKNNLFGWQIQLGQSYSEGFQNLKFNNENVLLSDNNIDRTNRFYFLKTGLKFDFNKDRLLFNYDVNTSNNSSNIDAIGNGFVSNDKSQTKPFTQDVQLVYQKRFNDTSKKIDFSLNFNKKDSNFNLNNQNNALAVLENNSTQKFYQFKTDYSQEVKFLDKTKFSTGVLADFLDFKTNSFTITNLEYVRKTMDFYTEFQSSYKSFDFILGGRLESYDIDGTTNTNKLIPFKQVRFFPNATIQYNIIPQVFINVNYNKKISLPNTSSLNPNNTNYQNPNINSFGNPNLDPTIFNNFEIKLSALEYLFVGYSLSNADNQVVNRIIETPNGLSNVSLNIPKVSISNFNFGLPIPYMIFTKGIKETLKFDFNPDEINFLNIYAEFQKYKIEGLGSKGFWSYNLMSQIILPKKINFTVTYTSSTTGGNYYYYGIKKPFSQQVDVTFSKKMLSNNLSISIYANDIFNTNIQSLSAIGTNIMYQNKFDSRRIGFSLTYKIPSKNKSVKEENILTNDKKEEKTIDK
jgi:Outer membrane protein beta-barrel family